MSDYETSVWHKYGMVDPDDECKKRRYVSESEYLRATAALGELRVALSIFANSECVVKMDQDDSRCTRQQLWVGVDAEDLENARQLLAGDKSG